MRCAPSTPIAPPCRVCAISTRTAVTVTATARPAGHCSVTTAVCHGNSECPIVPGICSSSHDPCTDASVPDAGRPLQHANRASAAPWMPTVGRWVSNVRSTTGHRLQYHAATANRCPGTCSIDRPRLSRHFRRTVPAAGDTGQVFDRPQHCTSDACACRFRQLPALPCAAISSPDRRRRPSRSQRQFRDAVHRQLPVRPRWRELDLGLAAAASSVTAARLARTRAATDRKPRSFRAQDRSRRRST